MNRARRIAVICLITPMVCGVISAGDIAGRFLNYSNPTKEAVWLTYKNPAMMCWRADSSLTCVSAGIDGGNADGYSDPASGKGGVKLFFNADTYTRYKSSVLWGNATYRHSNVFDVKWNETSDVSLVYPYITADSVGGDMKGEEYSFRGGYADHRGRWIWGVTLSYKAGLYYRNVDPRPRNITGRFSVVAGGGYVCRNYAVAASFRYDKYKQSCDIEFKNETGVEKIYHLTGLGTRYVRFDGTGESYYYDGSMYGVSINLYPESGRGGVCSIDFSRLTFGKVLTDLNRLQLASVWHNSFRVQAGWLGIGNGKDEWSLLADFASYRRHGAENIFGDPSVSNYPQIASLDQYADNYWQISMNGLWQRTLGKTGYAAVSLRPGFSHRAQIHASSMREIAVSNWNCSLKGYLGIPVSKRLTFKADVGTSAVIPQSGIFSPSILDTDPQGIGLSEWTRYKYDSMGAWALETSLGLLFSINSRYALGLCAGGSFKKYKDGLRVYNGVAELNLRF